MAFIEVRGVCKGYGVGAGRSEVLRDINLDIERGEIVAIVGYSGAGKTTLVSMIAGLLRPDTGTITMDGKLITTPSPRRGMVFQNYSLLPWLTVYENVALAVDQVFPERSAKERQAHVERFVAMVNLTPARNKRPGELSGGMRQRVALARALAMEPELLLLDEPLGALDALTRATLQGELARICSESGATILLITNDVDEGLLLADRIIPLGVGPAAKLGDSMAVTLARPRDKKALNHEPEFARLRGQIIADLISRGPKRRPVVAKPATPAFIATAEVAQ
jgi:nitrate/nitrite transport system ATP-binding protein